MLTRIPVGSAQRESLLGRTSPLVKLGIAVLWLIGLATTMRVGPGLALICAAFLAGALVGGLAPRRLVEGVAPLVVAAFGIALTNLLFSASNTDPAAAEMLRVGPLRLTATALVAALGLFTRVLAIVSIGGVFTLTTDPTRLVDALVQQGRVPPRFAYGALAAYQAVPRLGEDLAILRSARRLRGLPGSWHPRLLVGLLVRAIRHADQLALGMDARAFGSGPRTDYRPLHWAPLDLLVAVAGVAILVGALQAGA
jgi:energy-coupling factor transport system permease protein